MHTTSHVPMRTRRIPQPRTPEQPGPIEQSTGRRVPRPGRATERRRAIAEQLH